MTIVMASGGFDPLHVGHIRYLRAAKKLGDCLVVVLNGDSFLMRKKGYVFMPMEQRKEILQSFSFVDCVMPFEDDEDDVSKMIYNIRPNIFAKAGDRSISTLPSREIAACKEVKCKIKDKLDNSFDGHSSDLVKEAALRLKGLGVI